MSITDNFTIRSIGRSRKSRSSALSEASVQAARQIAHDVVNELNVVAMLAQLVQNATPQERSLQSDIATIQKAATHAAELCGQLQSHLRGAAELPADLCQLSLNDILADLVPLLEARVGRAASLKLDLAAALPAIVASPSQIGEVVSELVHNAVDSIGDSKAASDGERRTIFIRTGLQRPTESTPPEALMIGEKRAEAAVFLEVSDPGCGMSQPTLKRAFEPGFTTKRNGNGLGMASIQRVVLAHDGCVLVRSGVGKGTTIRCAFPCTAADRTGRASARYRHRRERK